MKYVKLGQGYQVVYDGMDFGYEEVSFFGCFLGMCQVFSQFFFVVKVVEYVVQLWQCYVVQVIEVGFVFGGVQEQQQ